MYVGIYIYICVFVCLCTFLMNKSLQPKVSLSVIPSFRSHSQFSVASFRSHSQFSVASFRSHSQFSVPLCFSRNTKKTNEFWIYAWITLRRWLSDVTQVTSAQLCFVKQPSFVLKAIGCNLVPLITGFPSIIFPLEESDIPEFFLYIYVFFFLQVGKGKIHNQKETYFIALENF